MNSNFNDNWMMYFGSALPQNINQTSNSNTNNAVPGDTVVFKSNITFNGTTAITNPTIEVAVTSGAQVNSAKLVDVQNTDTLTGTISQNINKTKISFEGEPTLISGNQYFVETKLLVVPVNNQNTNINNTIVSVETMVTGMVGNDIQQSVISDGLTINNLISPDVTPPIINAPPGFTINPNAAACTATLNLGIPVTSDNVAVIYTTNNAPINFSLGVTTITWTAYDAAGNFATAIQTVNVIAPVMVSPVVSSLSICSGNSTTLNATASQGTLEWYTASSGGTLLYTGTNFQTPILNNSITYYVSNDINGCKSSRAPLPLIVKETPALPVVNQPTICSGNNTILNAVVPSGNVEWYNSSNQLIGTSPNLNTPTLSLTTTYFVKNIANGCVGLTATVNVTIKQTPINPIASGTNICIGNPAYLAATSTGNITEWYSAPTNGNLLHTGTNYSISSLTSSQNYYVQTTTNGCVSGRTNVLVTVNSIVPDEISPTINGLVLLGNEDTLIYTCGAANFAHKYNWTTPSGMTILSGQGTRTITALANLNSFITGSVSAYASNACGNSNSRYLDINLPSTIAGPNDICSVNTTTYSVHPVSGATNYSWVLPAGITGTSNTNSIVVTIANQNFLTGTISVNANANSYSTLYRTKTINATPLAPNTITGSLFNVCPNTTQTYSANAVSNATVYNWTAPVGSIIQGSQNNILSTNSNSISVSFPQNFVSGNLIVNASNGCNTSLNKTISLTKLPALSSPGIITGTTNVCSILGLNIPTLYSITPVANVTSYYWTVPANVNILSGQGTNSILATFGAAFSAGNITVESIGSCINSPVRTLGVYKAPGAVNNITGINNFCLLQNTTTTYSVIPVIDATGYLWTVPPTATIVSGANTNVITVMFGNSITAGSTIKTRATNSCGGSAIKTLSLNICNPNANSRTIQDNSELEINEETNDLFTLSSIYPNPSNSNLWAEISSENQCYIEFTIFDIIGKKVIEKTIKLEKGKNQIETNVELFEKGVYVIQFQNKNTNQFEIKRFIKN